MNLFRVAVSSAFLITVCFLLTGCGGYQLRGRVIEGETSAVVVVEPDDPRLHDHGLASVSISGRLDPRSLKRQPLPPGLTRDDGTFAISVDATGAGFLEYEVALEFDRRGFVPTVVSRIPLPPPGKRLLVVMTSGVGKRAPKGNPASVGSRPGLGAGRKGGQSPNTVPDAGSETGDDLRREVDQFQKQFK